MGGPSQVCEKVCCPQKDSNITESPHVGGPSQVCEK